MATATETIRRLRKEMIGLLLWALAAFLVMSLLSHSSSDPSLNYEGTTSHPVQNWGGIVGAYLSDALLQGFGLAAVLAPLWCVFMGCKLVLIQNLQWVPTRWAGLIAGSAMVPAMFHLLLGTGVAIPSVRTAGGVVGYLQCAVLLGYLGLAGTWVAVLLLLSVSVLLATGTSVPHLPGRVAAVGQRAISLFRRGIPAQVPVLSRKARPIPVSTGKRKKSQPAIVEVPRRPSSRPRPQQAEFPFLSRAAGYKTPSLSLLDEPPPSEARVDREGLKMNARLLEKKLQDFGVEGKVTEVHPGPIVTLYEFEPAPGIKISRIVSLHDDLAMALRALSVRIIAPIPGKAAVGVEIPNTQREMVCLREVLAAEDFQKAPHRLTMALGKDSVGRPVVANLASMPHLLIAGATGSGKSVCLNAIITSILFKGSPQDVKFLMVDPKRLELSVYREIPHLLHPVVVEPKKAAVALTWAVKEMERRYRWMERAGVRNIDRYNAKMAKGFSVASAKEGEDAEPLPPRLPYLVIVIDELSDLMVVASREVEEAILRLAQMARAAGIHLVVATQRPSVDVLTGTIKINLPVRIAFQVTSKFDSRTILDTQGAENLLGAGDMLFLPPGTAGMQRIHGAYVTEGEIRRVVDFLKQQARPEYDSSVLEAQESEDGEWEDEEMDEKYEEAVALVSRLQQASISLVQRHLRIGYNRAARLIERMEAEGIVGPADGSKARDVLVRTLK